MWETFVQFDSIEAIMNNKGLAKVGDNIVNLCYSLAKSLVLGYATGEKVRDSVLARAIRATAIYSRINKRTDAGKAADAYEAIIAYLWMTDAVSISSMAEILSKYLDINSRTSRKEEGALAAIAFQRLLEEHIGNLPR
ncbi:MAG: hypothetical protein JW779_09695 [Candidatus Thorarchaeota archaeon]|nr:hypothetical protein [Candidatus Thorarchaeota archaeon]